MMICYDDRGDRQRLNVELFLIIFALYSFLAPVRVTCASMQISLVLVVDSHYM